jgi:hypothetical protein
MTTQAPIRRARLSLPKIDRPAEHSLVADLRQPIDGEVLACVRVVLNTNGIVPIENQLNTVVSGSKDICESKRYHIFQDLPCTECRVRFTIRKSMGGGCL